MWKTNIPYSSFNANGCSIEMFHYRMFLLKLRLGIPLSSSRPRHATSTPDSKSKAPDTPARKRLRHASLVPYNFLIPFLIVKTVNNQALRILHLTFEHFFCSVLSITRLLREWVCWSNDWSEPLLFLV